MNIKFKNLGIILRMVYRIICTKNNSLCSVFRSSTLDCQYNVLHIFPIFTWYFCNNNVQFYVGTYCTLVVGYFTVNMPNKHYRFIQILEHE